jgi:hypothetical protein
MLSVGGKDGAFDASDAAAHGEEFASHGLVLHEQAADGLLQILDTRPVSRRNGGRGCRRGNVGGFLVVVHTKSPARQKSLS